MLTRYVILVLVIAGALVTAVARRDTSPTVWEERSGTKQLKFSHKFHIKEAGVACEDCHPGAKTSMQVSDNLRPGHDQCAPCHEQQISDSCSTCHVNPENIVAMEPVPRAIIFAHAKHVGQPKVECITCHRGLDEVDHASAKNMPPMETCNTCHNDAKVTSACEACHISFTKLIPADHLVAAFKKVHRTATRVGALNVECATCHTQDFCAQCHDVPSLLQFGGSGAVMSDPTPRVSPSNSPNQMPLQMVHDLNYRYTHSIDAKSRAADCYSCHSAQTFCVECHATGDNLTTIGAFKPVWHNGSDFVTLGRGSGGGRHAQFARQDIESCVSCHDMQGMDATCVSCHFDADGMQGTDPATHPSKFHNDDHGSWHTDAGATCYNCHTDYNARPDGTPGKGFCGYCHSGKESGRR